jgi:hypothetical protein
MVVSVSWPLRVVLPRFKIAIRNSIEGTKANCRIVAHEKWSEAGSLGQCKIAFPLSEHSSVVLRKSPQFLLRGRVTGKPEGIESLLVCRPSGRRSSAFFETSSLLLASDVQIQGIVDARA